jgi:sulfofructose kinase
MPPLFALPTDARCDVVGVGINVVNYLYLLDSFPEPDSKVDPLDFTQQGGGLVATAMVACARLGLRTKYVGKVGKDEAGRWSCASLAQEQIDVADVVEDSHERTRITFGMIEKPTGRRTLIRNMPPLARLRPGEVPDAAVTSGRVLHLDGYEGPVAVWAARLARAAGIPVSLDAERATECRDELFPLADILIVGKDLGAEITGRAEIPGILDGLAAYGPQVVGVTSGAEGATVRHRGETVFVPGYRVPVVDTTGAGDVFHGAFVAGVVWGWPLQECVRLANAVAALKCRTLGGRAGIPSLADVRAFVRHTGPDLPPIGQP